MKSKEDILLDDLKRIIDNKSIRTLFQPIIDLKDGQILGYEALSRGPQGSQLETPYYLFDLAKKHDMLFTLEKVCREKAILNSNKISKGNKLFINVDPGVIYDNDFKGGTTKELIESVHLAQEDIVIELTETTCIEDFQGFSLALEHYKKQGYKIAIDDTGAGYSGLQSIVSISYNYIKLDRSLVMDIDKDPVKQALLETFMRFAKKINSKVIAEGIETMAELDVLVEMGVDYGQGYLIARPASNIPKKLDIVDYILSKNKEKKVINSQHIIGNIVRKSTAINTTNNIDRVKNLFKDDQQLASLPVLDNEKIVGLITRQQVIYSNLEQCQDIGSLIKNKPLVVDYDTSIEEVSDIAMKRSLEDVYDCIVVIKDDRYFGTVSIKGILSFFRQSKLSEEIDFNYFNDFFQTMII